MLAAVGCSNDKTDVPAPAPRADPQVVEDVIANFLPLPDAQSQARAQRVINFANWAQQASCGAKPLPPDFVTDSSGIGFPNLKLIREGGLGAIFGQSAKYATLDVDDYAPDKDCLEQMVEEGAAPAVLNYEEIVEKIALPWQDDYSLKAMNDPSVAPLRLKMAKCLREGSGLEVSDEDPDTSFKRGADVAFFRLENPISKAQLMEWSIMYADCAEPYFRQLQTVLEAERPALIERNREVIDQFAARLVELGYVP